MFQAYCGSAFRRDKTTEIAAKAAPTIEMTHKCEGIFCCPRLRAGLIAGSRAKERYEPRQVRKEAAVVTDSLCRGGAQLSAVPVIFSSDHEVVSACPTLS